MTYYRQKISELEKCYPFLSQKCNKVTVVDLAEHLEKFLISEKWMCGLTNVKVTKICNPFVNVGMKTVFKANPTFLQQFFFSKKIIVINVPH